MKRCDGRWTRPNEGKGQGRMGLMMQRGGNSKSKWEKAHYAADQNRLRHERRNVNVTVNVNVNVEFGCEYGIFETKSMSNHYILLPPSAMSKKTTGLLVVALSSLLLLLLVVIMLVEK